MENLEPAYMDVTEQEFRAFLETVAKSERVFTEAIGESMTLFAIKYSDIAMVKYSGIARTGQGFWSVNKAVYKKFQP